MIVLTKQAKIKRSWYVKLKRKLFIIKSIGKD